MTATIEIQAGQIWEIDGKLFHVEFVDDGIASVGLAYRVTDKLTGNPLPGKFYYIEADTRMDEVRFVGAKLVYIK